MKGRMDENIKKMVQHVAGLKQLTDKNTELLKANEELEAEAGAWKEGLELLQKKLMDEGEAHQKMEEDYNTRVERIKEENDVYHTQIKSLEDKLLEVSKSQEVSSFAETVKRANEESKTSFLQEQPSFDINEVELSELNVHRRIQHLHHLWYLIEYNKEYHWINTLFIQDERLPYLLQKLPLNLDDDKEPEIENIIKDTEKAIQSLIKPTLTDNRLSFGPAITQEEKISLYIDEIAQLKRVQSYIYIYIYISLEP